MTATHASARLAARYERQPIHDDDAYRTRSDFVTSEDRGRASVPMSKGWAVYNAAIFPVIDLWGKTHYVTSKRQRVLLLAEYLIAANDTSTTLRAMAHRIGCAPQTVSNALRQFAAWGMVGYMSSRGKYGGLTLFARAKADGLDHYARMAQAAIRAWWQRKWARFRAQSNVQSLSDGGGNGTVTAIGSSVWTLKREQRDDRIESVLEGERIGGNKRVPCPAHEGRDRNLSFWRRSDGSLGVKCWSHQCTEHEIKDAIEPWEAGR